MWYTSYEHLMLCMAMEWWADWYWKSLGNEQECESTQGNVNNTGCEWFKVLKVMLAILKLILYSTFKSIWFVKLEADRIDWGLTSWGAFVMFRRWLLIIVGNSSMAAANCLHLPLRFFSPLDDTVLLRSQCLNLLTYLLTYILQLSLVETVGIVVDCYVNV